MVNKSKEYSDLENNSSIEFSIESRKELLKEAYKYYTKALKDIQEELIKLNMQHDQDIINITDELNKISVNI